MSMITANELRIGNYVELGVKPTRVTAIRQTMVETVKAHIKHEDNDGVPITPEILVSIGFKKRLINDTFYEYFIACTPPGYKKHLTYRLRYLDCDTEREIQFVCDSGGQIHVFPCKYLHQLQNLYFALTNSELKIEL